MTGSKRISLYLNDVYLGYAVSKVPGYYHRPSSSLLVNSETGLDDVNLILSDMTGRIIRQVKEEQFYFGHYFIDVPAGVYLLQIRGTSVSESRKIIVK